MSIADVLVPEYDMEMEATRNLLERVPEAEGRWRPHPKSYTTSFLVTPASLTIALATGSRVGTKITSRSRSGVLDS